MRSNARCTFGTDAFALKNRPTRLVSIDGKVDRAPDDPGNLAALCVAKKMYRRACALSTYQWSHTSCQFHFVAVDLNAGPLDKETLIKNSFDPTDRTFWIAEGLLMYLPPDIVSLLMSTSKTLSTSGSQFAFTFMEKQSDGRIRFDSQSKLVDWWLRRRGEPFLWGTTRSELVDLARPWRVTRCFDHNDLRELRSGLADAPIAKGEVICLAEI